MKSQPEVAEFLGVTPDVVKTWRAKGMPGKPRAYDLQAIVIWLRSDGPWRRGAAATPEADDAQEQAKLSEREAKARLAWLQVGQREGKLLDRNLVHELFTRVGGMLRQAGEVLQRHYGSEALAIQNEALEEVGMAVREGRGQSGGDGTSI